MIKRLMIAVVTAGLLGVSAVTAAADETTAAPATAPSMNPMDPATFAGFVNPGSHRMYHQALMNPVTWMQFTQPQYYMQMANPALMMQWMNPASYQAMMNPGTYMYWMQPNVMMGELSSINPAVFMNPASYQAFMNPNTYMAWMNPAAYTASMQQMSAPAYGNWFDMHAWSQMMQGQMMRPAPAGQPQTGSENGNNDG